MINTINIIINYAVWLQEFYEGAALRSLRLSELLIRPAPDEVAHIIS